MAIGDTVQAGLMRVDSSAIERTGQANARAYGQMFSTLGKIAGDSIEKYAEGKRKKEEQDELIKGTKAFIMGNPELGRMLNIQATDDISYEEAVNQAVPSLIKNPKGLETFKGLTEMANEQQKAQRDAELFNLRKSEILRGREDEEAIARFRTTRPDLPITKDTPASSLPPLDPDPFAAPPTTFKGQAPAVAQLPKSFQLEGKGIIDAVESGRLSRTQGNSLMSEIQTRAMDERKAGPTRSEILAREKFEYEKALKAKENEPLAPVDPVYKESAIDAIDKAIEKSQSFFATGITGQVLQGIAGTDARDLAAAISTVEAAVGFTRLQEMRDASKTGGALGAINTKELQLLSASLGSLDPLQKPETLRANLISIRERYVKVLKSVEAEKYAFEQGLVFNTPQEAMAFVNNFNPSSPQQTANIDPAELEKAVQAKKDLVQRRKLMSSQNEVGILPAN